jgi:transposase
MYYMGMDVHKKSCYATVVDEQGITVSEKRFLNTIEELDKFLHETDRNTRIVMEATYSWEHIYDNIVSEGFDVCLTHPTKTRAIAEAKIKTDRMDSKILADLLRANLIPKAYVPSREIRDLRKVVRHRASLISIRTSIKNMIHSILAREGIKHDFSDLFGKKGVNFLKNLTLREPSRLALSNCLMILECLNERIEETTNYLSMIAHNFREVKLLTTVPGIGIYSALLILSEIGEIERFPNPKKLCSYAGLVPSTHQSGEVLWHGRITKIGSTWLRWVLIQSTHSAISHPSKLQKYYQKIKRKKGTNTAVVATARKMLVCIYWMLIRNKEFKDRAEARAIRGH